MCLRTVGYLLLKEMADPCIAMVTKPSESICFRVSTRVLLRNKQLLGLNRLFGSHGGPPAAMQNPSC